MNRNKLFKIILIITIVITSAILGGIAYSKYILNRDIVAALSSTPFYFEVEDATKNRIYALEDQTATLNIKASNGDQTNGFATEYTITLEDNGIFTFDQISGTIEANQKEKTEKLKLKLKPDFKQKGGSITFIVKTSEPYVKEVKVKVTVNKLGDYVKDLASKTTCDYNGQTSPLFTTDSDCNGDQGYDDDPPYNTYFKGTNDCLNFNYVWYSGYMWRITEILNDGSVKMISENILSAINFGESAYFDESYIKQWLNEDFLDTLYNYQDLLVTNATWDISPWYNWCYIAPPITSTTTVGLLNPYEFNITSIYKSESFLNLGHSWWLSSYNGVTDHPTAVAGVGYNGLYTAWDIPATSFGIRPMVVLKDDVKFSGTGTEEDPFVLLDDIPAAKKGDSINTRTPGELVKINGMLYRIVNTHEIDGQKVTKLKSANYITDGDEKEPKVILKQFGSMDMHSYEEVVNSKNENYWGAYLNGTWLKNQDLEKYLVEDTYYVDSPQNDITEGSITGSYKNTICKEKNTSETTKDCEKTDKIWKGYVGLPIVGELFAYPLGGNDTHDYKTATMTPYGDGSWPMIGAFETETQGIFQEEYQNYFAVKPTITLKEDVIIKSGDGKTPDTAFEIDLSKE